MHPVGFHLYKVLKQAKLTYGVTSQDRGYPLGYAVIVRT